MYSSKALTRKRVERTKATKQAEILRQEDRRLQLTNAKGEHVVLKRCELKTILKLAERYGWAPRGTNTPPDGGIGRGDWNGDYTRGEVEWIDAEDCANLADALQNVIANGLPSTEQPIYKKLIALLKSPGVTIQDIDAEQ